MGYSESGSTLFDNGITKFQQGQYEDAVFWFTKLIENEPFNAKAYKNRGVAHLSLQKYDMAIEDLKSALNLDPDLEGVRSNLGAVYHYVEKYREAIELYNEEINKYPENHTAFFNRALSWVKLNEYENALKDLKTVLTQNPNEYWALAYQGDLFAKLNNIEAARNSYRKAISLNSDSSYAQEQLTILESSSRSASVESPMTISSTPEEESSEAMTSAEVESIVTKPPSSAGMDEMSPISPDKKTAQFSKKLSQESSHASAKIKASQPQGYTIQLGAFLDPNNAVPLIKKLRENNYEPKKLNLHDKKKRMWTLVRVGNYDTFDLATKKMLALKNDLNIDAIVRPAGQF